MEFRLAKMEDLGKIQAMYTKMIADMHTKNIDIWGELYPNPYFADDIENNRLYIMLDGENIVAAFALSDSNVGENSVKWHYNGKAKFLDRFGVSVDYARQGMGLLMLEKAKKTVKEMGCDLLRLFVVDINVPAEKLYIKGGFKKAEGIFDLHFYEDRVLYEYGYEIEV